MKIEITQADIEALIRTHIVSKLVFEGSGEATIEFTAGRGEKGITASIDVPYLGLTQLLAVATKPASVPAPAAPRNPLANVLTSAASAPETAVAAAPQTQVAAAAVVEEVSVAVSNPGTGVAQAAFVADEPQAEAIETPVSNAAPAPAGRSLFASKPAS